jgi:hypothetical protein
MSFIGRTIMPNSGRYGSEYFYADLYVASGGGGQFSLAVGMESAPADFARQGVEPIARTVAQRLSRSGCAGFARLASLTL